MLDAFLKKLAKAGWKPHKGQIEYLLSKARFRVLACGRRWGKTDAAAADIAYRITEKDSSRQIAIAPTLAQARIVFERVKWMLLAAGVLFTAVSTPYPTIRVHEGGNKKARILHVLDARSGHEAKNLRGEGAHHILMDEAAFVPESLITDVAMPMLAANHGRMTLISTPRGRNFFYRFFLMGQRGEKGFWSRQSPSIENPAVEREYLDLQREILTESAFRTEYEAEFLDSSSAVFSAEALDAALNAPIVPEGETIVGVDWARYRDTTGFVAVRGTMRRAEVFHVSQWSALRWSEQIARVSDLCAELNAKRLICDATGVGDPVTEQLREAMPDAHIEGFTFTRNSKREIIERLIWLLERQYLRLPANPELLREMEHFDGISDEQGNLRYSASSGFHDDLICALAMACSILPDFREGKIFGRMRRGCLPPHS